MTVLFLFYTSENVDSKVCTIYIFIIFPDTILAERIVVTEVVGFWWMVTESPGLQVEVVTIGTLLSVALVFLQTWRKRCRKM